MVGRGRYELFREIGLSGAGPIFAATDRTTGETVAVKVLLGDLVGVDLLPLLRRYVEEFAPLRHVRIAPVYSVFAEGYNGYVVRALVEGAPLKDVLARPIDLSRLRSIASQVAAALSRAHAEGRYHGHLHAGNIFVLPEDYVQVTDFGLANVLDGGSSSPSPAQKDLRDLGIILQRGLESRKRSRNGNAPALGALDWPQSLPGVPAPPVPQDWQLVIRQLLGTDGAQPFAGADEAAQAIRELSTVEPPSPPQTVRILCGISLSPAARLADVHALPVEPRVSAALPRPSLDEEATEPAADHGRRPVRRALRSPKHIAAVRRRRKGMGVARPAETEAVAAAEAVAPVLPAEVVEAIPEPAPAEQVEALPAGSQPAATEVQATPEASPEAIAAEPEAPMGRLETMPRAEPEPAADLQAERGVEDVPVLDAQPAPPRTAAPVIEVAPPREAEAETQQSPPTIQPPEPISFSTVIERPAAAEAAAADAASALRRERATPTADTGRPVRATQSAIPWPAALAAIGSFAGIAAAEALTTYARPLYGAILHVALFFTFVTLATQIGTRRWQAFFGALTIMPLIRLISLGMPLNSFPQPFWYVLTGLPLFIATFIVLRYLTLPLSSVGMRFPSWRRLPVGLLVALSGFGLGVVEWKILHPAPIVQHPTAGQVMGVILILVVFTGLLEEFIFRGLLQQVAQGLLGTVGGWIFAAAVFAALHLGWRSPADDLFVLGVGLYFGLVVQYTRSLFGVSLAHGAINVMLFLYLPLYGLSHLPHVHVPLPAMLPHLQFPR